MKNIIGDIDTFLHVENESGVYFFKKMTGKGDKTAFIRPFKWSQSLRRAFGIRDVRLFDKIHPSFLSVS